jgi:hypothetical protein
LHFHPEPHLDQRETGKGERRARAPLQHVFETWCIHEPPRHHGCPAKQQEAGHPAGDIHPPQLAFEGGKHLLAERLIQAEAIEEFASSADND